MTTDEDDWSTVHYAIGLLMGVAAKRNGGVLDATIYYNNIHIRIELTDARRTPNALHDLPQPQ